MNNYFYDYFYDYLHDKKLYKDLFFVGVVVGRRAVKLSFFFENLIQVKFYFYNYYSIFKHLIKRKLSFEPKYIIIFDITMQVLKLL